MNQTIYPIGIQNFEKIRKDGYLSILTRQPWSINWLLPDSITSSAAAPDASGKPVAVHAGGLFPREKGAVRGTGHGETGKGLERIPDPPF